MRCFARLLLQRCDMCTKRVVIYIYVPAMGGLKFRMMQDYTSDIAERVEGERALCNGAVLTRVVSLGYVI